MPRMLCILNASTHCYNKSLSGDKLLKSHLPRCLFAHLRDQNRHFRLL
jgi:hypothetical protein